MKTPAQRCARKGHGGGIAVEMAIVLPILILLLASLVFFARVFWYYSVAQKAAQDAARFLSTASQVELRTPGSPAAALARAIVEEETAVLDAVMSQKEVTVQCNFGACGIGTPTSVRVLIQMRFQDDLMAPYTAIFYGGDGLMLTADVTRRYVGN